LKIPPPLNPLLGKEGRKSSALTGTSFYKGGIKKLKIKDKGLWSSSVVVVD